MVPTCADECRLKNKRNPHTAVTECAKDRGLFSQNRVGLWESGVFSCPYFTTGPPLGSFRGHPEFDEGMKSASQRRVAFKSKFFEQTALRRRVRQSESLLLRRILGLLLAVKTWRRCAANNCVQFRAAS